MNQLFKDLGKPFKDLYIFYEKGLLESHLESFKKSIRNGFDRSRFIKEYRSIAKKQLLNILYDLSLGSIRAEKKGFDKVIGFPLDISLATPKNVAIYRSNYLNSFNSIADLTVGVGFQSLFLRNVKGVDIDKQKLLLAYINMGLNNKFDFELFCDDALSINLKSEAIIVDPSRPLRKKSNLSILQPSLLSVLEKFRDSFIIYELPPLTHISIFLELFKEYSNLLIEYMIDNGRVSRINLYRDKSIDSPLFRIVSLPFISKEFSFSPINIGISIGNPRNGLRIYRINNTLIKNGLMNLLIKTAKQLDTDSRDIYLYDIEAIDQELFSSITESFKVLAIGDLSIIREKVVSMNSRIIPLFSLPNYYQDLKNLNNKLNANINSSNVLYLHKLSNGTFILLEKL